MFVLFILGLIFALGPMFLGMGVVLFGFLTSKEFWTYVGVIAVFGLYMFVLIPKLGKLSKLKKEKQTRKNSTYLYWGFTAFYYSSLIALLIFGIYKSGI